MAETDLALIRDGAGDAECLKAFADCSSSVSSLGAALLDRDRAADSVCPLCVLEADRLNTLDELVDVETLCLADVSTFLNGVDAVFLDDRENLLFASFVRFKQCHCYSPPYSFLGSTSLTASATLPY